MPSKTQMGVMICCVMHHCLHQVLGMLLYSRRMDRYCNSLGCRLSLPTPHTTR